MELLYGFRACLQQGLTVQMSCLCSYSACQSQHLILNLRYIRSSVSYWQNFQLWLHRLRSPPKRSCDQEIPLVEGARPISVRPYRYPPALKDEIESQVDTMLHQGIIQPNTSPFNSPKLLVWKKDETWCFCIDYRYLNALTVKTTVPIVVFDQLMDELAGARYFSTLDLLAGYHQIWLRGGEEHKTAFSTHVDHYEFRVVAFGLSGAPGTFQGAMNQTLKPLLCRCSIVFFDDILIYNKSFEEHIDHLRQVFTLLAQDQWHIKQSKCKFA